MQSIVNTQVVEWKNGESKRVADYLAAEEPLEMSAGETSLGVSLRTPGDDRELVAGFLFTEGIISAPEQLVSIETTDNPTGNSADHPNLALVTLGPGARLSPDRSASKFSAGSACGLCGKASLEEVQRRDLGHPDPASRFDPEMLCQMPEKLRATQAIFGRTGGLHAAALFSAGGELLVLREDIGRHNAVDKVIGWALLKRLIPLTGHALMVSGRGGFEIVQKALTAGIPLVASVSAPSSLAVRLAREHGLTFVGFLRGRRFVIYAGEERLSVSAPSFAGGA